MIRVRTNHLAYAAALALVAGWPGRANAQSEHIVNEVRELDQNAQYYFGQGDYEAAIEALRGAHQLMPATPRLFNIAVCYERLNDAGQAIEYYARFARAADADEERRGRARERIDGLLTDLLEAGRCTIAARELETITGLMPVPPWLDRIARCHDAAQEAEPALALYRRLLDEEGADAEQREHAAARIRDIPAEVERARIEAERQRREAERRPIQRHRRQRPSWARLSPAIFYSLLGVTAATAIAAGTLTGVTLEFDGRVGMLRNDDDLQQAERDRLDRLQGQGVEVLLGTIGVAAVAGAALVVTAVLAVFTRWPWPSEEAGLAVGLGADAERRTVSAALRF